MSSFSSLPPELMFSILRRADRRSVLSSSLASRKLRALTLRHCQDAFAPILGVEFKCGKELSLRVTCRRCAAHDEPNKKVLAEKVFQRSEDHPEDKSMLLAFGQLADVLRIPASQFDLVLLEFGSVELSCLLSMFSSLPSPPPLRSICLRTVRGTNELCLPKILDRIGTPSLVYLHIWHLSSLRWDSRALRCARTVCVRSDIFLGLPTHLKFDPRVSSDTVREVLHETLGQSPVDDIVQEFDEICGHRHLFQLNRLREDSDPILAGLRGTTVDDELANALKYHIRNKVYQRGPKHRTFIVELLK